jgi:protein-disulfide isomerase
MTESKGPDKPGGTALPGKKKRKGIVARLRPYAVGTMAIVVVFGGSALIGAHVRSGKEGKVNTPTGVVGAAAVPTGPADTASPSPTATTGPKFQVPVHPSIPVSVTIYEDLRSPDSKAFADEYQATIDQLLTTGQVQIHYQLVTASDKGYGGKGSRYAANAAACAQDQGRFTQFVQEVWNHQPDPKTDGLASEKLMKHFAVKAGKIKMGNFEPCLEQGDHNGWVTKAQSDFVASGLGTVPAVQINGKAVKDVKSSLTPSKLRTLVNKEAKRVVKLQDTPSPTPSLAS